MKKDVVNKMIQYFPELDEDINAYLADFHEIYLHLIFGDIFNPYLLNLLDDPQANLIKLTKASELIEYMSKSDISIQEVVVTTVLERLSDDREKFTLFSKIAGEHTCQFIDDMK